MEPGSNHEDTRRHDIGWERLTRLNNTSDPRVVERVAQLAPRVAQWIVEFGYGDAYDEQALPARERQLITIGALTAMGGAEAQLDVHMAIALNIGIEPRDIAEAVSHCVPYCGFPRVINALEILGQLLERRGIPLPSS
jgi:4-carboxymuconolactone decarboxylase